MSNIPKFNINQWISVLLPKEKKPVLGIVQEIYQHNGNFFYRVNGAHKRRVFELKLREEDLIAPNEKIYEGSR